MKMRVEYLIVISLVLSYSSIVRSDDRDERDSAGRAADKAQQARRQVESRRSEQIFNTIMESAPRIREKVEKARQKIEARRDRREEAVRKNHETGENNRGLAPNPENSALIQRHRNDRLDKLPEDVRKLVEEKIRELETRNTAASRRPFLKDRPASSVWPEAPLRSRLEQMRERQRQEQIRRDGQNVRRREQNRPGAVTRPAGGRRVPEEGTTGEE